MTLNAQVLCYPSPFNQSKQYFVAYVLIWGCRVPICLLAESLAVICRASCRLRLHLDGVKGFVATVKDDAMQLLLVSDWNSPRPCPGEAVRNYLHVWNHLYVHYHRQAAYNAPRLLERSSRNPKHSRQLYLSSTPSPHITRQNKQRNLSLAFIYSTTTT